MERQANKRGRPVKYADPAAREEAAKQAKARAAKRYYEKKGEQCCARQRQYYEAHREAILQKIKETRPPAQRRPGRPRKLGEEAPMVMVQ